jgi:N-acetylmuramoyl-L-alanine amidase
MIRRPYSELTDEELYELCVWRESDDQPADAMRAVAHSIMNRVLHPGWWGVDLRTVLLAPEQYSCFDEGGPDETRWPDDDNPQFIEISQIVDDIVAQNDPDNTDGATNYYDVSIEPPWWTQKMQFTVQLGKFRFYKEA